MKPLLYLSSAVWRLCVVFCLAAAMTPPRARGQERVVLLDLKACQRELQVFEDGAVVESRHLRRTERQFSAARMRKLRQVIAGIPCARQWRPQPPAPDLTGGGRVDLITNFDCAMEWLSSGMGLDEIQVTLRYEDRRVGPFPVYVVCDHAKEQYQKSARSIYQKFLKPNWQRFLADVSRAVGGPNILKGCDCWQY